MEDDEPRHDVADLWPAYLHYFREQLITGVVAMTPEQQRTSRAPSGWTPLELLSHVLHMEQRWFVWGFLAEQVDEPWGDWNTPEPWRSDDSDEKKPGTSWVVADDVTAEALAERLRAVGRRTTNVLATHPLDAVAAEGGRFDDDPASLEWICFHVLQEYARHAGHLDIVRELGDR